MRCGDKRPKTLRKRIPPKNDDFENEDPYENQDIENEDRGPVLQTRSRNQKYIFCSFVGPGGITMAQQPHFQALRARLNVRIRDRHEGVNTTGQFQSILVY